MPQVQIQHLSFSYEGSYEEVFHDVSLTFDTDWKLGFVGRNGRGKTTLLHLLLGDYPYQGTITSSESFEYFPFPVPNQDLTALEIAEQFLPQCPLWQLCRELGYMEMDAGVLYRPFQTLSPGEQTRLLLAILFLKENQFLLIDEPTNHLDLMGRQIVAGYLKRKKGFLLVSHDRSFLDACTDHTMAINKTGIEIIKGSFSAWWENKRLRDQWELSENERLKKEISRLQDASRQAKNWSDNVEKTKTGTRIAGLRPDRGAIGHKAAKMMKRAKVTEAHMERELEKKSALLKDIEQAEPLKLFPLAHHKTELLSMESLTLGYGGSPLFSPVNLTIKAGEKVALYGKNGSGKSSLFRYLLKQAGILSQEPLPSCLNGKLTLASGLVISYVPQDTSFLKGSMEEFIEKNGLDQTVFHMLLRKLDFSRHHLFKPMEALSAGQRKKILLAKSLSEKAHLYLWDEPLNYIDIFSRIQLEQLLQNTHLTILWIEHDRSFTEKLSDHICYLTDNLLQ